MIPLDPSPEPEPVMQGAVSSSETAKESVAPVAGADGSGPDEASLAGVFVARNGVVLVAKCTVTANGTINPVESQRARDLVLARSACSCGHARNFHHAGDVTMAGYDWRGGTGPCGKKGCKCKGFAK